MRPDDASIEARYRAIVEQSHDLLLIVDAEQRVRWGNAAFEQALGYPVDGLVGAAVSPLIHEDDLPAVLATIERLAAHPGSAGAVDFRMRASDGTWHFLETSATNLLDEPAIRGFVVSLRDVTKRVAAEGALKTSEQRYQDLIDRAHDLIFEADMSGRITSVNAAAEALTGFRVAELLTTCMFDLVVPEEREHAAEVLARMRGGVEEVLETQLEVKGGRRVFVEVSGHIVERDGAPPHVEGIARDVTERHLLEERLRYDAIHDALTALPNRLLFLDRLGQALARRREGRALVAVMLLDVDEFKLVNDELGHAAGDGVLVELARRLRASLRSGETIARLGGDEFALVADTTAGRPGLVALAQRVLGTFAQPFAIEGARRFLNGSLGIAVADGGSTPQQLLRDADTAMYRVKATRRGTFAFFDASMRDQLVRQLGLREALAEALRDRALEVHYQPVHSLASGTVLAVEALVRWPRPAESVDPDDFIPLAEQSGLIIPLGRFVLDEAVRQAARWRRQDPDALQLGVFVNVSPRELADPTYTEFVAATLRRHRVRAAGIALELTERVFIDSDDDVVIGNLESLSAMGVRLVLDDFGTGYSALSSLERFPFAALKIDRSFIEAIASPEAESPITKAVVGLGESLGMTVIAEGVETDVQLDYMRNLDCAAAQGFRLARPQTATDISALLRRRGRRAGARSGRAARGAARAAPR